MTVSRRHPRHHGAQADGGARPSSPPIASPAPSRRSRTRSRCSTTTTASSSATASTGACSATSLAGPLVGRSYEELLDAWIARPGVRQRRREPRALPRRAARARRREPNGDVRRPHARRPEPARHRPADGGGGHRQDHLGPDRRRPSREELREARAAAEAASAAKSEFLSSMSHELRTPLNAILGLRAAARSATRRSRCPTATRSGWIRSFEGGEHLLRLIDDILDLSRIEAGRVSISTEPVGVTEVLDEVRRPSSRWLRAQGIRARRRAGPPRLPMVCGRSDALRADPDELRLERDQVQPAGGHGDVRASAPRRASACGSP